MKAEKRLQPRLLWLYLSKQIMAPFYICLAILLCALSLERLLRLVDMVAAQGAEPGRAFLLMAYLIPHYLSLAMPAAFFFAVLLAFRQMQDRSELAVIQAAGISLRDLRLPVLILATALTGVMLGLSGYVEPFARYDYRAEVYKLSASGRLLNLRPGILTAIGKNMTAQAENVTDEGRNLESVFFIHANQDGEKTYISAKSAMIEREAVTGRVTLVFQSGNMIRESSLHPIQTLNFTQYPLQMPASDNQIYGARGRDEREMTFAELLAGGVSNVEKDSTRQEEIAELHARLVQAFSLPFLGLLALVFALIGGGRTGKAYGIAIGVAFLIFYDKILGFGAATSARGHLSPWISQWGPLFLLFIAERAVTRWKIPENLKIFSGKKVSTP